MDVIISLVGFNPIPNYCSILNYCNEDTIIYLLYTNDNIKMNKDVDSINRNDSSEKVADNIKETILKRFPKVVIEKIGTEKSDFKSIISVSQKIKSEIESINKRKVKLLLDITGSTKPNSAFINYILTERFEYDDNIRLYKCYVSNEKEKIYQSGYEEAEYSLKDIAQKKCVTKEEILNLHGYDEYLKKNENIGFIKGIFIEKFTLIFYMKTLAQKINKIKEDIFIGIDISEKLGGSLSRIFFEAESFLDTGNNKITDEESGQEYFLKMLENETNKNYEERIILKSCNTGYCTNKDMEKFIRGQM